MRVYNCIKTVNTVEISCDTREESFLIQLNYRDTRPIYEQIKESYKKLIITGALPANEKLPSVRAQAVSLSINPNTIQRAYNELEDEGYVYSIPGKGSFVCPTLRKNDEEILEIKKRIKDGISELRFLGVKETEIEELFRGDEKNDRS